MSLAKHLFLVFLSQVSFFAYAHLPNVSKNKTLLGGTIVGSGGDAYICESKGIIEMFDTYEARKYRALLPALGEPNLDVMHKVELALNRVFLLDPLRAHQYRRLARLFFSEARIVDNVVLPELEDAGIAVPEIGCSIRQLAVQVKPLLKNDPHYLIDGSLWAKLDNDNKAILVLHEIIYRTRIASGDLDSQISRRANAYVFSNKLDGLTVSEFDVLWQRLLQNAMPDKLEYNEFKLTRKPHSFHSQTDVPTEISIDCEGAEFVESTIARENHIKMKCSEGSILVMLNQAGEISTLGYLYYFYPTKPFVFSNGLIVNCTEFVVESSYPDEYFRCLKANGPVFYQNQTLNVFDNFVVYGGYNSENYIPPYFLDVRFKQPMNVVLSGQSFSVVSFGSMRETFLGSYVTLEKSQLFKFQDQPFRSDTIYYNPIDLRLDGYRIDYGYLCETGPFRILNQPQVSFKDFKFDVEGAVIFAEICANSRAPKPLLKTKMYGSLEFYTSDNVVWFYKDGYVKKVQLAIANSFLLQNGRQRHVKAGEWVTFSEEGFLTEVSQ